MTSTVPPPGPLDRRSPSDAPDSAFAVSSSDFAGFPGAAALARADLFGAGGAFLGDGGEQRVDADGLALGGDDLAEFAARRARAPRR